MLDIICGSYLAELKPKAYFDNYHATKTLRNYSTPGIYDVTSF